MDDEYFERRIDAMFERSDEQYFETMNGVIAHMHNVARMCEIQAELGRLSTILREVYPQWESLVHERIMLATRIKSAEDGVFQSDVK